MPTVGVIGAGTMGAGIAQVAAAARWDVVLSDVSADVAARAVERIDKRFTRLVEKGRMSAEEAAAATARIHVVDGDDSFAKCALVIEAVVEDLEVKTASLARVARRAPADTVLATNTSSLSVTRIGEGVGAAERTIGMHFFNPVPLMPLVEVVAGRGSDEAVVTRGVEIARAWGKTPVRAADTPGFIVNRVARGYYLEAMRMLGEGVAGIDEIDAIMKRLGGFRMGPFELMDLVGIDVNYTVSRSVWEQLGRPARLTPHPIQKGLFEKGYLGRKSKRGWYSYQTEHPLPAVPVERQSFETPAKLHQAVRAFCEKATDESGSITEQLVFARTLAAIINEAALAVDDEVASPEDIDTAMKLGTNYPHGPLEWADRVGRHTCRFLLDALNATVEDGRFEAARWLRQ